QIPWFHR
uniref:Tryptophyllin-5.1 n=1 Tax=Litoria rubella TaxID=104895 RepID=TY51_LITRU|nr:RecName: Full=Tryptophyllin-5.1 [Litoria rubella]